MNRFINSILLSSAFTFANVGCSQNNLSPLEGKVVLSDIDFQFAGDTLEIRSQTNPREVAYGEIRPDGSFVIESLKEGLIVKGAASGDYEARVIVADDDFEHKAKGKKAIPKKYTSFETSGLKLSAPSRDATLTLSK